MMIRGIQLNVAQLGRVLILVFLSTAGASIANAASIPAGDSMGVGGTYSISGTQVGGDWTLTLGSTVEGLVSSGVITVDFSDSDTVNQTNIDLDSFTSITNLFTIDGWQVDLQTLVIGQVSGSILELDGTGFITGLQTGNEYDRTAAVWSITGNTDGSTYSMTVTAVPVPAAVWLFGSGLVGLITVARRKKA